MIPTPLTNCLCCGDLFRYKPVCPTCLRILPEDREIRPNLCPACQRRRPVVHPKWLVATPTPPIGV